MYDSIDTKEVAEMECRSIKSSSNFVQVLIRIIIF